LLGGGPAAVWKNVLFFGLHLDKPRFDGWRFCVRKMMLKWYTAFMV